jgi:septal ring factor EnvC (AmiA/AmiB activator)
MPKPKARGATSLKDILAEMRGHGVILEDIRSQNRATMEALQATRAALEEKIDQVDRNSQARDAVLEAAVRQNSKDIRTNSEDIRKNSDDIRKNSDDIRVLATRVDALGPLDQRVSALERRPSR